MIYKTQAGFISNLPLSHCFYCFYLYHFSVVTLTTLPWPFSTIQTLSPILYQKLILHRLLPPSIQALEYLLMYHVLYSNSYFQHVANYRPE